MKDLTRQQDIIRKLPVYPFSCESESINDIYIRELKEARNNPCELEKFISRWSGLWLLGETDKNPLTEEEIKLSENRDIRYDDVLKAFDKINGNIQDIKSWMEEDISRRIALDIIVPWIMLRTENLAKKLQAPVNVIWIQIFEMNELFDSSSGYE